MITWLANMLYTGADILVLLIGDADPVADHFRFFSAASRQASNVNLLGDLDGVVDLDAEVADGAVDLSKRSSSLFWA